MKITIFGASSPTGKLLIQKALARGYEVRAFVRDETKLGIAHPNLNVICGDALNPSQVDDAVRGSDAVLSTLGPKGKPAVMAAESTKNIVNAMQKHGVKRLVVVSVAGIPVAQDQRKKNLVDGLLKLLLRDVFVDREKQLTELESSNVSWTALRVPRLTDGLATGSVKTFFGKPSPRLKITRADLADFMLEQIKSDQWNKQAPILSN
jgi:putative NADH-flavin reductase